MLMEDNLEIAEIKEACEKLYLSTHVSSLSFESHAFRTLWLYGQKLYGDKVGEVVTCNHVWVESSGSALGYACMNCNIKKGV